MDDLKRTPLFEKHIALGARMVPFGGWEMPVQYTGIIEEHLHTRAKASIFDICHMGEFIFKGVSAESDVDRLVTCNIKDLKDGCARYGFILNDQGGIIDDMIVFRISREEYMMVVNAGTIEKDKRWIERYISRNTDFADVSDKTAKIDLQGPAAPQAISILFSDNKLSELKRFNFVSTAWKNGKVIVSATGYTGEKGYEIFMPVEIAGEMWDALLAVDFVKPAGLGARDSLRLEKGYSLYGHEINDTRTPVEANLDKFVQMNKDFLGKSKLLEKKNLGHKEFLTGFVCKGRRSAREKFMCVAPDGTPAGSVTSGVFSPCLKLGVGMCYVDKNIPPEGAEITLTDGKIFIEAVTKRPPFVV